MFNWTVLGKYAMGTALLGSVGFLTWIGKVDATTYVTLVVGALTALGLVVTNAGPKQ